MTKSIDEISAGQVAYLIWSIGKLSKFLPSGDKHIKIFTQLCHFELKRTLAAMHGQNIGMVAFGLANMPIENFVKKPNLMEIHEGMHEHIQRTIDVMTWQSIAHVDLYTRKYSNANASMKLKMNEIATNASKTLSKSIKASAKELEKLIFEGVPTTELWGISEGDRRQKTVLMIDLPRRLCKKYKKKGFKVLHWNRFMEKDCEGRTWLSEKSLDAKIDGCLLGLGIFKENFAMVCHCLTKILQEGAYLYIYNKECRMSTIMTQSYLVREMEQLGMFSKLESLTPNVMKSQFQRFDADGANTLKLKLTEWRSKTLIEFDPSLRDHAVETATKCTWYTFPGLFAGGVIDIMTAFFLNTVKKEIVNSQKFKRVLDFCCGSGTIAYAYKNFIHTLKNDISISLLDADSVALEAAKKNVKDAKQYYLSDGWYSVDSDEQFDLILSNPPVHVGHHDCFDVVSNLIGGAVGHLSPGGELWVVCQNHIPLGSLAPADLFAQTFTFTDGRFCTYRFVAKKCSTTKRKLQLDSSESKSTSSKKKKAVRSGNN